ncbi:hypothetical protein BRPE64_ACDS16510 [Caballeronia insecticola]|uniref:Uncharacterized protein n=1 Tax=Caballeronia insecticola TaxID=758793 RepID=R4WR54_9BURK|nr:hypothetical protein BRPE64_ACDS16510 [Caballeronia insecticola]
MSICGLFCGSAKNKPRVGAVRAVLRPHARNSVERDLIGRLNESINSDGTYAQFEFDNTEPIHLRFDE